MGRLAKLKLLRLLLHLQGLTESLGPLLAAM
jgi:hypothetical protein